MLKAILTPIFYVLFRVKVEGRENIPKHGPAVLAANHQSFCDSFFIPLVVRRKVTYLAKAEYFDSWKTAWFFRAAGQIPIRRGGRKRVRAGPRDGADDVLGPGPHPWPLPRGHPHARPVRAQGTDRRDEALP